MRVLQAIKSFVRDHFKPTGPLLVVGFFFVLIGIRFGLDKLFPNSYPLEYYPELSDISIGTLVIITIFAGVIGAIITSQILAWFDERNN